ncbi:hypothetical protein DRQ33_04705, partial [bacterium]
ELYCEVIVATDVHSVASGLNNQRTIVRDSGGNLYIAYSGSDGANYQIYIAFSSDGGATWDPRWATITSNSYDDLRPSIAIDSYDTLHLAWEGNIVSGNDADLMYRKYPGGSNTVLCAYSAYPGAHSISVAVGPDDDVHIVYSGCPSSWLVRYLHYDRVADVWEPAENVGTNTPSRWPSVEIDNSNNVHSVYRNQPAGNYRAAHRAKVAGSWLSVEQIDLDSGLDYVEYTSMYIDNLDNIHAVWVYRDGFGGNPDTIRYRRYNSGTSNWETIYNIFGDDTTLIYSGDVVVDTTGMIYVFYHDQESCYVAVSSDGGVTFPIDSSVTSLFPTRYPNARGSNFPYFNRITNNCIDFVYVWYPPDSSVDYLIYDNICGITAETTLVCGEFVEPAESSFSSCSDQQIVLNIGCCEGGDTTTYWSDTSTVEYFDSTTMSWESTVVADHEDLYPDSERPSLEPTIWVWSENPAESYNSEWFRMIIDNPCTLIDSAYINIQVNNQGSLFVNGNYIDTTNGSPLAGEGWGDMKEWDLTPYLNGGFDTISIVGTNDATQAGLIFKVVVICATPCCGEIDTNSIQFTVNGSTYTITNPELTWDGDSMLTFTPIAPDTFQNADTITACLISAGDTCGGMLDSSFCKIFFVDLTPPVVFNINPPPDTTILDTLPEISFNVLDSLSGVDTSLFVFYVDSVEYTPSISSDSIGWQINWTPPAPFGRGDTVVVCISVSDTTLYCANNVLDTCWVFYILPCVEASTWIVCPPETSFAYTTCDVQTVTFGIWDSTGMGIDTGRIYVSAIIHHLSGVVDTVSPTINYITFGDTLFVESWYNWIDGDSVIIRLDSLYSNDGCITIP